MTSDTTPPKWAEALLLLAVGTQHFEAVSGDLLEEYLEHIEPTRGTRRADAWYVWQVLGFLARGTGWWAIAFAGANIARGALDWFVPTEDFHLRSSVSTWLAVTIFLLGAARASWRSGSPAAGPLFALAIAIVAMPLQIAGATMMLAIWHDAGVLAAIQNSGGLSEVFLLPVAVLIPALLVGVIGGLAGAAASRMMRAA
jgi:hypothetical protein